MSAPLAAVVAEAVRRHRAGLVDDAKGLFEGALQMDPEDGVAQHFLGVIHWQAGEPALGESLIRRSLSRLPALPDFYNNLGLCLQAQSHHEDAIDAYERALAIDPDYVSAHNNLGLCKQERGDLREAIEHFDRAIALMPNFVEAKWNLQIAQRALEAVS